MNKNPEGPPAGEAVLGGDVAQVPADSPHAELVAEPQPFHGNGNGKSSGGSIGSSLSPPPTSTPGPSTSRTTPAPSRSLAAVIQDSDSTRELLIGIAQSAEEVSRASNEKYYLARHVYDLVSARRLHRWQSPPNLLHAPLHRLTDTFATWTAPSRNRRRRYRSVSALARIQLPSFYQRSSCPSFPAQDRPVRYQ